MAVAYHLLVVAALAAVSCCQRGTSDHEGSGRSDGGEQITHAVHNCSMLLRGC